MGATLTSVDGSEERRRQPNEQTTIEKTKISQEEPEFHCFISFRVLSFSYQKPKTLFSRTIIFLLGKILQREVS